MVSDSFPNHLNPYLCTFIEDLARRLGAVVDMYVLTLKRRGDLNEDIIDHVHIFRVLHIENPLYTFLDAPLVVATIVKLVGRLSIDLIHAQFAYPSGFYSVLARKIVKRPVVITTHRYDVVNLKEDRGAAGIPFFKACSSYALKRADAVLPVSEAIRRATLKLGAVQSKTFVVYNAVNEDLFNYNLDGSPIRKELRIEHDEKMLFTLGHLVPRKGVHYLLDALQLVAGSFEKVRLVIGGDGPERDKLMKSTKSLGLKEKVNFVGRISRDKLPFFYAASNLFVLPSIHEGHCVALLEAMASGLPLVATRVGGNVESVVDGYNGFLVPPKNQNVLAEAILKILSDENLELQFGNASLKLYNLRFSSRKQIQKIFGLYQNLLKES
jgi:glycosyltransferase involved in cell wall biosynthesis